MFVVTRETIDASQFTAAFGDGAGGSVTFFGSVRGSDERGRAVEGLTYEAYEPMALREFETIAEEARKRFGARRIAIVHRIGDVGVGEIAVAVAATADHRSARHVEGVRGEVLLGCAQVDHGGGRPHGDVGAGDVAGAQGLAAVERTATHDAAVVGAQAAQVTQVRGGVGVGHPPEDRPAR